MKNLFKSETNSLIKQMKGKIVVTSANAKILQFSIKNALIITS